MNIGYTNPLFILAFDHRSSFRKMFEGENNNEKIKTAKIIVYEAFKKALAYGVSKEEGAILVDEEFGSPILLDAKAQGFTFALTVEKNGQEEFDFEYGEKFGEHIKKYVPTFAKALVRYDPQADNTLNARQLEKLKKLSDYCREERLKLLVELIVQGVGIPWELEKEAISQFQNFGVEPDVWKLEGLDARQDYEKVVEQAKSGGRENISIVILGRGESKEKVEQWIKAGLGIPGVIGFAIGRTIFWEVLSSYNKGAIGKDEAIEVIAQNYLHFYNLFKGRHL